MDTEKHSGESHESIRGGGSRKAYSTPMTEIIVRKTHGLLAASPQQLRYVGDINDEDDLL